MSETTDRKELNALLRRLREEWGEELGVAIQGRKATRAVRRKVRDALKSGMATVPAIAETAGISTDEVLWHVTAMRKYGEVAESGMEGSYPTYRLLEREDDPR